MEDERLKVEKEKREERERERQERRKGQQGIGQCKLLSIVRNGASACYNQSTNFRMRS